MTKYQELLEELKMLHGLQPYNTPSNLVYGDSYFANSISNKYSDKLIKKAKKELGIKIEREHKEPLGAMEIAYRKSRIAEEVLFGSEEENTIENKEETKMKKVEMTYGNEVALVQVNEEGRVEVVREGQGTQVLNAKYDFETAVKQFEENGWTSSTLKKANDQRIPLHVQQELDEFLDLHAQIAELNAKADKLKKNVREYMDSNDKKELEGSKGKRVVMQAATASNSTSVYSDYELGPVAAALNSNEMLREVTEIRINAKKLEALLALDKLPKAKVTEIKGLKITNPGTPRFTVKK